MLHKMKFWLLAGFLHFMKISSTSSQGPAESPLSFCAVRESNLTSGSSVLPFTSIPLNDGGAFDLLTNSFTVPVSSTGGYFWLAWSIGILPSVHADVRLLGALQSPDIIRKHSNFTSGVDTTSRTELVNLTPQLYNTITLSSDFGLFSDAGWQTSMCGFSLFSTMSEVVAFSVGKSTTTTASGTIVYDVVNVDTHTGYSSNSGEYTIQKAGVYVVSFSVAAVDGTMLNSYSRVRLCLVSNCFTSLYLVKADEDLATQTVLVDTAVGQTLSTMLDSGYAYSDIRYQTALKGFLYSPARSLPHVWSVANQAAYAGTRNPLPFEVVLVNRGSGWNAGTYTYTVQSSGVHYVHLTAGIYPGYPTKMELLINGLPSVNVYRQSTQHQTIDARSRAIILRLAEGDQLKIRLPAGFYTHSDTLRITTFSGFRLYD